MAVRPLIRMPMSYASPSGSMLAFLYAIENLGRAMLATTLALFGLEVMGSTQDMSLALFGSSVISLIFMLCSGILIRLLSRKIVFTLGCVFTLIAMSCYLLETPLSFFIGSAFRACAGGFTLICISLYTLDFIPKDKMPKAESRKILFSGLVWVCAPGIGTWMWVEIDHNLPFIITAIIALMNLTIFWWLRIREVDQIKKPNAENLNIFKNLINYISNAHMRVAYLIAVCRSAAWVVFFTYGPIYILETGISKEWIGFIMGFITSFLVLSPQFLKFAQKIGIRLTIIYAFITGGVLLSIIGLIPKPTIWAFGLFFLASLCMDMLDVIGNLPFLRTVRQNIRVEMTSVFSTWREFSFTLTPGIGSILLIFLPVQGVFLALGTAFIITGFITTKMPVRIG
ncbi:MAG: MFS transporter [Pseudomonadota bacterium]